MEAIPTVVDDRRAYIAACNGKVAQQLDAYAASMTKQGGRQKREGVHRRGERTAAGFQRYSEASSLGDQKAHGGDRSQVLLWKRYRLRGNEKVYMLLLALSCARSRSCTSRCFLDCWRATSVTGQIPLFHLCMDASPDRISGAVRLPSSSSKKSELFF